MKRIAAISILLIIILFGFALFMQASVVHACAPPTPAPDAPTPILYSIEDFINGADYILVGTVITGTERYGRIDDVEIEVEQYLKGEGATIIEIQGLAQTISCYDISIGQRYIFFATESINGTMQAFRLRRSDWGSAWYASDENIEEIIAITNHSVAPYPMPISQQIQRVVTNDTSMWVLIKFVLPILVLGGYTFFKLRRDPRKPKAKHA